MAIGTKEVIIFSSVESFSKIRRFPGLLSLIWLAIFVTGLTACGPVQDTRAELVATSTATPRQEAVVQLLSTRIAEGQKLIETSEALETQAAHLPTTPETPAPTVITPQATTTSTPVDPALASLLDDIPLPPGEKRDLFTSDNLVSFLTQTGFTQLVLFFENQYPVNHWVRQSAGSFITTSSALLYYTKDNRKLSISLRANPISGLNTVLITLQQ